MNSKLLAISNESAQNLCALVKENEEKLLEAWSSCESEAQANENKPKFKLALSITLDLDADKMTTELSWGVRYKATAECTIPDPDQGKLPLLEKGEDDTTVTLTVGGKSTRPVPLGAFKKVVEQVVKKGGAV